MSPLPGPAGISSSARWGAAETRPESFAFQEHSCPQEGLEPVRRAAKAKRAQAVLGPPDPDTSRAAAGVGFVARDAM
eukprot:6366177-Alexandrium_andersonii.AAC.1